MRRMIHRIAPGLLVMGVVTIGARGRADSGETNRMTAETLFVEAKKLMEGGDFARACPKFADSQRLDPGVGALLNLALCYERWGKVASAWSTYREAASAARGAGQTERESVARQRAAGLEARLSRLTLTVPQQLTSAEGVEIRLDGAPIPQSLWGVAAPVDPGEHSIEVTAKGRKPWSTRVTVVPPTNQSVSVPDLEAAPADTKIPGAATADDTPPHKDIRRPVAIALGGLGVVGIAVGTVFGLSAKSTYHQADPECNANNVCSPQGTDLRNTAYGKATISTIAFGVGGAALASGVILWLTAPAKGNPAAALVVAPRVAGGPAMVSIEGAW